jgi:hypothetical protein
MGSAALRLRRALRVFAEGAGFFAARIVTDETSRIVYAKGYDFDAKVLVDPAVEGEQVRAFAAGLRRRSRAFELACRMIRLAATALRTALYGAAAALGGFVPLLLGLASAYSQMRVLDEQLEAYEAAAARAAGLRCR